SWPSGYPEPAYPSPPETANTRLSTVFLVRYAHFSAATLWLDISHFDGLACVKQACEAVGAERLLFSTNYPFFYARSAALKIQEEELARGQAQAVTAGNALMAFGIS
ncbi:MAG: hypothetical protein IMF16_08070, partial [Proteobacteria bacterium]|nr:hypothetical protein [Pseudomonadota bacterium]